MAKRTKDARTKDERLKVARRAARAAVKKSRVGALALVGVRETPKNPKADVRIHDGDSVFVVWGQSRKGTNWIARNADHSDGFEGVPIFGVCAYTVPREHMAPILRGIKAAGLTVTK